MDGSPSDLREVDAVNVKNKKCIRRLSFRTLRASRKRNLIAVLAIALTTLLFTSLFTIVMSMNKSYESYSFRQIGGYSHGSFKDVTDEQAKAIAAHPKVKETGSRVVIGFLDSGVFSKSPAEVSYMDASCTKWSYAVPEKGHMPQTGKEVAMDTKTLKLLDIEPEIGAEITLTYRIGDKNQTGYEKTDTFILTGWWEYDEISPVHYINISEEYMRSVEKEFIEAGNNSFRQDLNVMMASSVDIRGQMEQVDLDLGYDWKTFDEPNSVRIGVNWGYTSAKFGESIDVGSVLAAAAFLILVVFTGYLIIYNIFQISVTGDIRFYGLLKTIGVTPRQLRRIIRQQALFLCIVGIPLGLLLGYGVGALLTPVVLRQTSMGAQTAVISASPLIFLVSALFALATVLLSCFRPGRIAAKVSPVEAAKYTEAQSGRKKKRTTRGAKVHQMAFANLGRNKSKTVLVVISLALSVVLLNTLATFVGGFDMEKYLSHNTCADFILSSTDYFRFESTANNHVSEELIENIENNTSQTLSGCAWTLPSHRPLCWMDEEIWKKNMAPFFSGEAISSALSHLPRHDGLIGENCLVEGLDPSLFEKVSVIEGSLSPLLEEGSRAVAVAVSTDDYGNVQNPDLYPEIGSVQTITYVEDAYYIDSRTGEKSTEDTPEEFLEYHVARSHDAEYTVCALIDVPYSMSYRFSGSGFDYVLPVSVLEADSGLDAVPLLYLFDTPDAQTEKEAEALLQGLTGDDASALMYESKATVREKFQGFQDMFVLLGGLLCAIIGLVGILNFFNAVMTGILSRQREFAVLQSIGMTGRQLNAMLVYEGLFYALGAALTALLISVILTPLIGNFLEDIFWFFSFRFRILPVLAAVPVFAFLGWLLPTLTYRQAKKFSIVERLRDTD